MAVAQLYIIAPKMSSKYMPVYNVFYEKTFFFDNMICLYFYDDF